MESVAKRSEYRRAFDNLGHNTGAIDRRCLMILKSIQDAFVRDSSIGAGICKLTVDEKEGSAPAATFESPIGNGRIVRKWAIEKAELFAKLVFERAVQDKYGATYWEPTCDVVVSIYGVAVSGTGDEQVSFTFNGYNDDERFAAFAFALAMLRGLVV